MTRALALCLVAVSRPSNRFAFTNKSLDKTTLALGRQRIVLDDSRFVGNVGWRQSEQTYDGLRAQLDGAAIDFDRRRAREPSQSHLRSRLASW